MGDEKDNEHAVQHQRAGQAAEAAGWLWQRELWRDR
jgi:hypothetical protein